MKKEPTPWPQGKEVGLLDIDICGPSAPLMLGQEGQDVHKSNSGKAVQVDISLILG